MRRLPKMAAALLAAALAVSAALPALAADQRAELELEASVRCTGEAADETLTVRLTALEGAPMPEGCDDEAELDFPARDCRDADDKTLTKTFDTIVYTAPGIYEYTVTQDAGGRKRADYDDTVFYLKVMVAWDTDGELKVHVSVRRDGDDGAKAELLFKNSYRSTDPLPPPVTPPYVPDKPTPTPKPSYDYSKPVPQAGAKDNSWFRDAAFVGDSRMEGVMNYAGFEYASNFSHVGLNVADVFTKPYIETESGSVTVADALHNDLKYGKVYVMLGINELGWYNLDKFVEYYGNIVDLLRETHPEADIYIISILPVGAKAAKSSDMLNNDRVRMFNERIQGMCADKQVYFVNGFEALASNGSLPDDASPDGIHMQPSYCHKLTDYLLTHTVAA